MVETIVRREYCSLLFQGVSLIIIDEAHILRFKKVLELAPENKIILGFTATPKSSKPTLPLKDLFQDIVVGAQIPQLIQEGFLSKERLFKVNLIDEKELEVDSKTDDFSDKSNFEAFDKPKIYEGVLENYKLYCEGEKTIIFCVNQKHAENLCKSFLDANYTNIRLLTSDKVTDEQRKEFVNWFRSTHNAIIINVGILTKGFDVPNIQNVIINRATTSIALWLQMCGRGSRVTENKDSFKILDFGGNSERLGKWSSLRDWEQIFWNEGRKEKKKGVPVLVACENCEALIPASAKICSFCGHSKQVFEEEVSEKIILQEDVESLEFKINFDKTQETKSLEDIIRRQKIGGKEGEYSFQWVVRQIFSLPNPYENLKVYANLKGYKQSWVNKMIELYS
jgi:superfamily II DNA or RNA helicase